MWVYDEISKMPENRYNVNLPRKWQKVLGITTYKYLKHKGPALN